MTENQNNPLDETSQNLQPTKETSSASDGGAHLENFVVPDIDDVADDVDAPIDITLEPEPDDLAEAGQNLMDKNAFWTVFQSCFSIPAFLMPGMKQLAVQKEEETAARAASDATYSLLEIYYPNALMPQGEVFAHLMVAAPFFFAKAMIVREVLRARNAKPANPPFERSKARAKEQTERKPETVDYGAIQIGEGVTDNWEIAGPMQ